MAFPIRSLFDLARRIAAVGGWRSARCLRACGVAGRARNDPRRPVRRFVAVGDAGFIALHMEN